MWLPTCGVSPSLGPETNAITLGICTVGENSAGFGRAILGSHPSGAVVAFLLARRVLSPGQEEASVAASWQTEHTRRASLRLSSENLRPGIACDEMTRAAPKVPH